MCLVGDQLQQKVADACTDWKGCLETSAGDRPQRIQQLLNAAGVGSKVSESDRAGDSEGCIYPPTEDPASWDCDCWDGMQKRCDEFGATDAVARTSCLTAQYCLHPRICKGWQKKFCEAADI